MFEMYQRTRDEDEDEDEDSDGQYLGNGLFACHMAL